VVLGRRLFDLVDGPNGWNDETGYGAGMVGKPAFVVVTSSAPDSVRLTDLDWTFVTTGIADAVTAARKRAETASSERGEELDVVLMGGGATIGSALAAGVVDALTLHLAPVVLGAGTPLFTGGAQRTLVQRGVTWTSNATHLTYDVVRGRLGEVRSENPRAPGLSRTSPGSDRRHALWAAARDRVERPVQDVLRERDLHGPSPADGAAAVVRGDALARDAVAAHLHAAGLDAEQVADPAGCQVLDRHRAAQAVLVRIEVAEQQLAAGLLEVPGHVVGRVHRVHRAQLLELHGQLGRDHDLEHRGRADGNRAHAHASKSTVTASVIGSVWQVST
jgi:dihydrofolate reductase